MTLTEQDRDRIQRRIESIDITVQKYSVDPKSLRLLAQLKQQLKQLIETD